MKNKPYSKNSQKRFYDDLCSSDTKSKTLFSCSYEERFDPFLLVNNPEAFEAFHVIFSKIIGNKKCLIIDCCTGSGQFLPVLHLFSRFLIGIDISFNLLSKAQFLVKKRNLGNTVLIQSEAENIALKDNLFDVIVLIDSLHHVENQERMIQQMKRIARNKATLILIEPNIVNPLIFFAHVIPAEERGALRRSTAPGIKKILEPYVGDIRIHPLNYIASQKKSRIGKWISKVVKTVFEKIFPFWPIRLLIQGTIIKEKDEV